MTIRVLVADDQAMVRTGVRLTLAGEPDIEVVAEAADGIEAVAEAKRTSPDVALRDIRMPRMDGLEALKQISGFVNVVVDARNRVEIAAWAWKSGLASRR